MMLGKYIGNDLYINEKLVIDANYAFRAPEVFKLIFDKDKLILVENIRDINY